jgi:hypothetical protein
MFRCETNRFKQGRLFAGGLAVTIKSVESWLSVIFIYSLALPGYLFAVTLSWIGEVTRMMRAAAYLRERERELCMTLGPQAAPPLRWETWLAMPVKGRRNLPSLIGPIAIFFGAIVCSSVLSFLFQRSFHPPDGNWWVQGFRGFERISYFLNVIYAAVHISYIGVCGVLLLPVYRRQWDT